MPVRIRLADLDAPDFVALVRAHAALMLEQSPPESCHFLPLDGLRQPGVTVWEMRDEDRLLGCGALQALAPDHAEIKSMHTLAGERGKGLGRRMLDHLLEVARARGYRRLSLETGSMAGFLAARRLYETAGFVYCAPFGSYVDDPNSVFMTLDLTP